MKDWYELNEREDALRDAQDTFALAVQVEDGNRKGYMLYDYYNCLDVFGRCTDNPIDYDVIREVFTYAPQLLSFDELRERMEKAQEEAKENKEEMR